MSLSLPVYAVARARHFRHAPIISEVRSGKPGCAREHSRMGARMSRQQSNSGAWEQPPLPDSVLAQILLNVMSSAEERRLFAEMMIEANIAARAGFPRQWHELTGLILKTYGNPHVRIRRAHGEATISIEPVEDLPRLSCEKLNASNASPDDQGDADD